MTVLLPILALVLIGGRLVGRLATRLSLPSVFGELILGLIVGPFIVTWMNGNGTIFTTLGNIGVLVLMLLVGLETDVDALKGIGFSSFFVACCGAVLPFITGAGLAYWLGQPLSVSLIIGVALSATSVSITAATLRELGKLQSQAGRTILMAAVIDDVIGLLFLTFVTSQESGKPPTEALIRVGLIIVVTVVSGFVLTPVLRFLERRVENFLTLAIGVAFLYAWSADFIGGLAPITGAYVAGLVLARAAPKQQLVEDVEVLASGFFATIFFVSLGLNIRVTSVDFGLLGIFVALAIATKILGCGFGAKVTGSSWKETIAIGVGMIPRGEVALIVASIGLQAGILNTDLFSMLVLMTVATTVITPLFLRVVYGVQERKQVRMAPEAIVVGELEFASEE